MVEPVFRRDLQRFFVLGAALIALTLGGCAAEPGAAPEAPVEVREPVEASARVDRAVATTGDVITFSVVVDHEPGYEIELDDPGAEIAGFRIVDIGRDEPVDEGGRRLQTSWYKLRADLVGSYVLPPVTVRYRTIVEGDKNTPDELLQSEWESLQTSEIFVEVETVLTDDAEDIRGLKPLRVVEPERPWWHAPAAVAAISALLALALWRWKRGREEVVLPPRPAHEIAFEKLEQLRRTDFEDLEAVRQFYFEISEVVREYVEARFGLNATDLTTEEILPQLAEVRDLRTAERDQLTRFLQATDQVKFAAAEPSQEEIQAAYEDALSFVEATRAVENVAETPAASAATPNPQSTTSPQPAPNPQPAANSPAVASESPAEAPAQQTPEEFIAGIPDLAESHIKSCREFFGVEFAYDADSLKRLDDLIEEAWEGQPPNMLDMMVMQFGSYVGETFRRLHDGEWKHSEDYGYHLLLKDHQDKDVTVFPYNKVRKRFTEGEGDSIGYYYVVVKRLLEGELKTDTN